MGWDGVVVTELVKPMWDGGTPRTSLDWRRPVAIMLPD